MPLMLVIADDLTGAADCGVACASHGLHTLLVLGDSGDNVDSEALANAEALSVDGDTRRLPSNEAAAETTRLLRRYARDGETLIYKKLDSTMRGNVGAELAAMLEARRGLTIVTNSLMAAATLMTQPHRLILVGGEFRALSRTLVGPLTASVIQGVHVQKAFMGTIGFTLEDGMSTTDPNEAFTKEQVLRRANQVFLLVDSSKLGVSSFSRSGALEDIDTLITDSIGAEFKEQLEQRGVEVLTA